LPEVGRNKKDFFLTNHAWVFGGFLGLSNVLEWDLRDLKHAEMGLD
jgi:hypothetical protein